MKETVKTKPSKEYGVLQHSAILETDYGKKTDMKKKALYITFTMYDRIGIEYRSNLRYKNI